MFKVYDILEKDLNEVSFFIKDNFLNFPPYKDFLSIDELNWFIYLNSPEKLLKKINNKKYITKILIRNSENKVCWICFAELENININSKICTSLCIKRMHWNRFLIEKWIYEEVYNEILKFIWKYNLINNKIKYLTVVPSNHFIKDFFLKKNFIKLNNHHTKSMQKNNIPKVSLLWKEV